MPSLTSLPVELLNSIYTYLDDRKDMLSLRHTCRKLAVASHDGFDQFFESIMVTSSVDGLTRLQRLVADAGDERLSRITYVTIHTLTAASLKDLAVFMQQKYGHSSLDGLAVCMQDQDGIARLVKPWSYVQDKDSIPYLLAYKQVRTVLIGCLNRLPNLKRIIITNFQPENMSCTGRVRTEAMDPLKLDYPRLHAFESALSILPSLKDKACELYLSIDGTAYQEGMCGWPMVLEYAYVPRMYGLSRLHPENYLPTEWRDDIGKIRMLQWDMFGVQDYEVRSILDKSLRRMELSTFELYAEYREFLIVLEDSRCTHMQMRKSEKRKYVEKLDNWFDIVCVAPGHETAGDHEDKSWDHRKD